MMDREMDFEITGGKLRIRIRDGEASVVSCRVFQGRIVIPDQIEGAAVTAIERKAFLSCHQLREISLPRQLREIGDWGFAHCSSLTYVWLPRRHLSMGKGVFKDCASLSGVFLLEGQTKEDHERGMLLGTVPVKLEAEYLFTPGEAWSGEWLQKYDGKLQEFLRAPDEDGYAKMVYCGEEDIMANMDLYLEERKRAKARLCFIRLGNPVGLMEEFRQELCGYLREHTKGCESEAAWEVVYREHGGEQEYYRIFTETGCVTEGNYDAILSEMGERYPEMKGYLMRYRSEEMKEVDFFDLLSLD